VIRFVGFISAECVLSGFTIRQGNEGQIYGTSWDQTGYCEARIENNVITQSMGVYGAVAFCHGLIRNNTIQSNSTLYGYGAVAVCNGTIENNVIVGNGGDYSAGLAACDGIIQNNVIVTRRGWAGATERFETTSLRGTGNGVRRGPRSAVVWSNAMA